MWRYQRNLNGLNEGLNVVMHLSHVGACTGRDHFSGWSLDWINLALGYLPFLRRFYAPADARAAFRRRQGRRRGLRRPHRRHPARQPAGADAGRRQDAALERRRRLVAGDDLPRAEGGARRDPAIGAPSFLAGAASDRLAEQGTLVDVYVINGFPVDQTFFNSLPGEYGRIVTIEDGVIGTVDAGLRGFAAYVAGRFAGCRVALDHLGIVDPQIAPSDHLPAGLGALRHDRRRHRRATGRVTSETRLPRVANER